MSEQATQDILPVATVRRACVLTAHTASARAGSCSPRLTDAPIHNEELDHGCSTF